MMKKRMMNQEDAAIAAAIAAVEVANNAAALVDTVAAAGAVRGSDAEAMDATIYDFAASILYFIIHHKITFEGQAVCPALVFSPAKTS
jgi:hypothetical protein